MSGDWKPGDVGLIRPAGEEAAAVGICFRGPGELAPYGRWRLGSGEEVWSSVRSVRRLVVIDPEDASQVEAFTDTWVHAKAGHNLGNSYPGEVEHMTTALREFANPVPRIEEPQGLGAVVEDSEGVEWVRTERRRNLGGQVWQSAFHVSQADRSLTREWEAVKAVRKLSNGWTP
jgi:hypothetical protein